MHSFISGHDTVHAYVLPLYGNTHLTIIFKTFATVLDAERQLFAQDLQNPCKDMVLSARTL